MVMDLEDEWFSRPRKNRSSLICPTGTIRSLSLHQGWELEREIVQVRYLSLPQGTLFWGRRYFSKAVIFRLQRISCLPN